MKAGQHDQRLWYWCRLSLLSVISWVRWGTLFIGSYLPSRRTISITVVYNCYSIYLGGDSSIHSPRPSPQGSYIVIMLLLYCDNCLRFYLIKFIRAFYIICETDINSALNVKKLWRFVILSEYPQKFRSCITVRTHFPNITKDLGRKATCRLHREWQ